MTDISFDETQTQQTIYCPDIDAYLAITILQQADIDNQAAAAAQQVQMATQQLTMVQNQLATAQATVDNTTALQATRNNMKGGGTISNDPIRP